MAKQYEIREFDDFQGTFYRVVERSSAADPWRVVMPCIDYRDYGTHGAGRRDAEWKVKELQAGKAVQR